MCVDDSGEQYLSGVVSWGIGCATEGYPGAFANVRKFKPWIEETMAKYSDCAKGDDDDDDDGDGDDDEDEED